MYTFILDKSNNYIIKELGWYLGLQMYVRIIRFNVRKMKGELSKLRI